MKSYLLGVLLLTLASCSKKAAPEPDPFLGPWQAQTGSMTVVNATGQVLSANAPVAADYTLVVTATTLQFTFGTGNGAIVGQPVAYTRSGETLTLAGLTSPSQQFYARSITASTFNYETTSHYADGSVATTRYFYHR